MKAWRESASLMLTVHRGQIVGKCKSTYDYKVLCLKRHQRSSFMAGAYVFPGGVVDPADCDLKWREFFSTFGFNNNSFVSLIPNIAVRPQIFRSLQNELPKEISLRITAIRETFEESGILVCKRKDDRTSSAWAQYVSLPKDELDIWRTKVHSNAVEFFTLCEKYECYPDLWALHEWRNWLTPVVIKKRYNTAFFLTCMPTVPYAEYETIEMQDLKWETPENCLSPSAGITLPPPQLYEITKLMEFKSINNLLDYAMNGSKERMQLYLPVPLYLKDGLAHVLPGDIMYPKKVNLTEKLVIDKSDISMDEYHKMMPRNRVLLHSEQVKVIRDNTVHSNHISRVTNDIEPEIKNKL